MRNLTLLAHLFVGFSAFARAQDLASGPEKGAKIPELKVFDATGAHKDKDVDYAADRKGKSSIYLFINAEKFDRPMNRFMKTLDGVIIKDFEGAYIVAVWLNGDAGKIKELLPKVQPSIISVTTVERKRCGTYSMFRDHARGNSPPTAMPCTNRSASSAA